jgi:hypothetical protein
MFPDYRKQNNDDNNNMNNQQEKFHLCVLQNESVKTVPSLQNVATDVNDSKNILLFTAGEGSFILRKLILFKHEKYV